MDPGGAGRAIDSNAESTRADRVQGSRMGCWAPRVHEGSTRARHKRPRHRAGAENSDSRPATKEPVNRTCRQATHATLAEGRHANDSRGQQGHRLRRLAKSRHARDATLRRFEPVPPMSNLGRTRGASQADPQPHSLTKSRHANDLRAQQIGESTARSMRRPPTPYVRLGRGKSRRQRRREESARKARQNWPRGRADNIGFGSAAEEPGRQATRARAGQPCEESTHERLARSANGRVDRSIEERFANATQVRPGRPTKVGGGGIANSRHARNTARRRPSQCRRHRALACNR